MGNTIYASFIDASLAEKAAGALLDHGVRAEDISVVRGHNDIREEGEYTATSPLPVNEQAWTGENRNTETERLSYTGNINYSADPNLSVPPTYEELNATNKSFGTVAADASTAERDYKFGEPENFVQRDATVYPGDRVIENRDAMTTTAVGHDPNNWPREDHNQGDVERAAKSESLPPLERMLPPAQLRARVGA